MLLLYDTLAGWGPEVGLTLFGFKTMGSYLCQYRTQQTLPYLVKILPCSQHICIQIWGKMTKMRQIGGEMRTLGENERGGVNIVLISSTAMLSPWWPLAAFCPGRPKYIVDWTRSDDVFQLWFVWRFFDERKKWEKEWERKSVRGDPRSGVVTPGRKAHRTTLACQF